MRLIQIALISVAVSFLWGFSISGNTTLESNGVVAIVELFDSQPIQGVHSTQITLSDFGTGYYHFNINESGEYFVRAVIQGQWNVLFYDNVFHPFEATPLLVNEQTPNQTNIDFNFTSNVPNPGIIHGIVLNQLQQPVTDALIQLFPLGMQWNHPYNAISNPEGTFHFPAAMPGQYILKTTHRDYFRYYYDGAANWQQANVITTN